MRNLSSGFISLMIIAAPFSSHAGWFSSKSEDPVLAKIEEIDDLFGEMNYDAVKKDLKQARKETVEGFKRSYIEIQDSIKKLDADLKGLPQNLSSLKGLVGVMEDQLKSVGKAIETGGTIQIKYTGQQIEEECAHQEVLFKGAQVKEERLIVGKIDLIKAHLDPLVAKIGRIESLAQGLMDEADDSSSTDKNARKELKKIKTHRSAATQLSTKVDELRTALRDYYTSEIKKRADLTANINQQFIEAQKSCKENKQYMQSISNLLQRKLPEGSLDESGRREVVVPKAVDSIGADVRR